MLSVRTKLIAGTAGLIMTIVVITSAISLWEMHRAVDNERRTGMTLAMHDNVAGLQAILDRLQSYADLLSRRRDIAVALQAADFSRLEPILVAEFQALNKLDPAVNTLEVTDAHGIVFLRGHNPAKRGDDKSKVPNVIAALSGKPDGGMSYSPTTKEIGQDAIRPLMLDGQIVGTLKVGSYLRKNTAESLKELTASEIAFLVDGKINAITVPGGDSLTLTRDVTDALSANGSALATITLGGEAYDAGFSSIKGLVTSQLVLATLRSRSAFDARLNRQILWSAGIGILILGLSAAATVAFAKTITVPLAAIEDAMVHLAGGDTATEIPGHQRTDEIGAMAKAVLVFRDNAVEREQSLLREKQTHAAQNRRQIVMTEVTQLFQHDVEEILQNVGASTLRLRAASSDLTKIAGDTVADATSVAAAAEQASANVATVASATEQLTASEQEINRQIVHSANLTECAVTEAARANRVVSVLRVATREIGDIVNLIRDIAAQTNLLALNATIEAARAGDAGKGFAVVANEVKTLASQTARATENIAVQIGSVCSAAEDAVAAINQISDMIQQISQSSGLIATTIEQQNAATREISRNIQEASVGTREVTRTISQVRLSAVNTGGSANGVKETADEMSSQAEILTKSVTKFLTAVDDAA
jgi:methyl-accepting chemotaxis protein